MDNTHAPCFTSDSPDGIERGWLVDRLWGIAKTMPSNMVPIDSFQFEKWVDDDPLKKYKKEHNNAKMDIHGFIRCRMEKYVNDKDNQNDFERISQAEMKFSIIINQYGELMDGYHRFVKAYFSGNKTILVTRFVKDPDPDFVLIKGKEIPWNEYNNKNVSTEVHRESSILLAWKDKKK